MSAVTTQKKKVSYFREVYHELRKVTWTSREELKTNTKAVIIATFAFGLAIYGCDFAIRSAIDLAGSLMRIIFG